MENILLHPLRYIFQNTCFFNGKQISVFYGKQISVFYGKQKYVSLLQVGNQFWDFGPLLGPLWLNFGSCHPISKPKNVHQMEYGVESW